MLTPVEKEEVISFAHTVLVRYFCECDVEYLVSAFAPDIVWMGAGEMQKAEGAENVARCFREGKDDLAPCRMWDEEYEVRGLGGGAYLCSGQSWLEAEEGTGLSFRVHQRITFLLKRCGDTFQILHIHNSAPFSDLQDDELFPAQAGRAAYDELQKTLYERESQIDLMLSQLPGGMLICYPDDQFTIKWISGSLAALLGYASPKECVAACRGACLGFMEPGDYASMREEVAACFAKKDSYTTEYRVRKKDGSLLWMLDLGKKAVDRDGEEVLYCFLSDITQRREQELRMARANEEIHRQAAFLSQLYDTLPCGILQFSTEAPHRMINANRMAWELYGYEEEEYRRLARNVFDFVLDRDQEAIQGLIQHLARKKGTVSYEREARRKDGSPFWIRVTMERLINADGQDVYQAIFIDVTETRRIQQEREQEQLLENRSLRAAIRTAYPLIMNLNLTANTYTCLGVPESMAGRAFPESLDDMLGECAARLSPGYEEEFESTLGRGALLSRFQGASREAYLEFQEMGDDGAYHWISIHVIHVDNPYNDDVLAIALLKSLDRQRAEKARQEQLLRDALASAQAANRAKSDFLSRMSHDIRTPMNAIIGMSAIGQLKLDNPGRALDCFQKIDASSKYLLSLINDILDMSKIEQGKMTLANNRFDFTKFIEGINAIIYPQALAHKIRFEVRHREPLERCYIGDSLRLNQILMNLLSNALKFTPRGGSVTLEIREARRTNGFAYLEFVVRDTGAGMSREFMNRLYQPFEQESTDIARNQIGSGLGLSIVYNLVQLMGGTVGAESEKGRGTSFTVTVPLERVEDGAAAVKERSSKEPLKGVQVLVVDDDAIVGEQTSVILSEIGARSLWVDSGRRAVEEVRKLHEKGGAFDIALIDWLMPGMDGVETTRQIRGLVGPDTTVIILSAYDWSGIEEEARAAGATGFIPKPLFQSSVCDVLQNLNLAPREPPPASAEHPLQGKRVLLVEDNELNLEIAKSLLEFEGVEVDTAVNGQLALEAYRSAPERYYLAVLMDIRMPVLDGLCATRAIRALPRADARQVPIIAMTANAFEEDRAAALQAGMNSYLVKPIDINKLFAELHKLCE